MADTKTTKLIDTNALLYYHSQIKLLLGDKVDKKEGYSLMSDAEIARLSSVVNYNDKDVQDAIKVMQGQIDVLEKSGYDDTALKSEIAKTYATIAALNSHAEDTEIHITDLEREAWNAKLDTADIPAWAMKDTKPTYTAEEVGADATGAAATAKSEAVTAANAYTDGKIEAVNTAAGTLGERVTALETTIDTETTGLSDRMDTAEGKIATLTGDGSGSVAKALVDAKAYADGLAVNYDAKGAAANVDAKIGTIPEGSDTVIAYVNSKVGAASGDTTALAERVTTAEGDIDALEAAVEKLNGADSVDGSVAKAVKDSAASTLEAAKGYANGLASNYEPAGTVDAKIGTLPEGTATVKKYIDDQITTVTGDASDVADRVTVVEGKIETINGDGVGSIAKALVDAKAYSDGNLVNAKSYADGKASTAQENAGSYTDTQVDALRTEINGKLTSAMHYKGSVADFASLPSEDVETGDVYNIVAAGTDADGKKFSAGANAAWNGTAWDILAGTVDLTNYYNTGDIAKNSDIDSILNS